MPTKIRAKQLDSNYQIILVGLTQKQIAQLPNNIIGINRTECVERLAEAYASSDVFLNPTYEDSFPTTNLESLACGTPVITYKSGGSPEAIDDLTGTIIEQGNIGMLVDAIKKIKDNGKLFYTSSCVERAYRLYRKDERYHDYLELYDSLLLEN